MKCRHPLSHRLTATRSLDLATGKRTSPFRQWCSACEETVPLGPSNDTEAVELEILAAAIAENPMSTTALHVMLNAAFDPRLLAVVATAENIAGLPDGALTVEIEEDA